MADILIKVKIFFVEGGEGEGEGLKLEPGLRKRLYFGYFKTEKELFTSNIWIIF